MSLLKKLFGSDATKREKPEVLMELRSPACPITAIVEQDNQVAYFYLWGDEDSDFGVKACWIRNLDEAPINADLKQMEEGIPPMLTKAYCRFSEGQIPLQADDLEIVWFEEGDGAALMEKGEVIAIIPSWAGMNGFSGYARDCVAEGDYCWELKSSNILLERVRKAKEYWRLWDLEVNPFHMIQPQLLQQYEDNLGKSDQYFAIDGNEWPPRGLFLKKGEIKDVFVTVGLSLLPMPVAEMYSEDPNEVNRIELGFLLNAGLSQAELNLIGSWISGQAGIPWRRISWLGNGHTVTFNILERTKMTSVVLVKHLNHLPDIQLENYRDSQVNILWMVPITEKERNFIIDHGFEPFSEKLNNIGSEIFNIDRDEINLS